MLKNKRIYFIPFIGFTILISIGALLLSLPMCNNKPISAIDALFISTSSTCVTGFSTVNISEQFNILGQLIILLLMQIGALGFMIFIAFILILKHKRIRLSDTMLIGNAINSEDYTKIKEKIIQIIKYTFFIEFIGAAVLAIKFIPVFGIGNGLWYGIFHSVAAFCNAGLDLFGNTSFVIFRYDVLLNIVFMILIILGGIGFFVIDDIVTKMKMGNLKKINFHSKIVIFFYSIVLLITALLIYLFEKNLSIMDALFSSVTLRTAGFYTIDFNELSISSKIISIIAMFIGGAPGSTSGGIRIVVFAIVVLTTISILKNQKEVIIFNRKIETDFIKRAIALIIISIVIILTGILLLVTFDNFGLLNITFHVVSSFSAVGLTLYNCALLNFAGKIITIILMFIGRVGPITIIELFIIGKRKNENISYVSGELIL